MTDAELLTKVKTGLMITGTHFDEVLKDHIYDVKSYLKGTGIPAKVVNSEECVGLIKRGVSDLMNNGSGDVKFSPYFYDRASQLVLSGGVEDVPSGTD